ncbi:putative secreted glycosyl hydrolase [Aspergillus venezuelensis]
MRVLSLSCLLAGLVGLCAATNEAQSNGTQGIDLFGTHLPVNYEAALKNGVEFVFVKATEGSTRNLRFNAQTNGARKAGLLTGAIHFATASTSSGAEQAEYFLAHGGNWTSDGLTLPGVLEMEGNIAGKLCHGMNSTEITEWMMDFSNTYKDATGRRPMLFLSAKWWNQCAGDDGSFGTEHPLWLANWADEMGALPVGWKEAMFWQYSGFSRHGGEADVFFGTERELREFALGV